MRPRRVTQKDILIVSISTFGVVMLWVIFNFIHTSVTSTVSNDLQIQIVPIEGKFDTNTIDKLKNREKVSPIFEISSQSSSDSGVSLPDIEPTPVVEPTLTEEIVIPTDEPGPTEVPIE